LFEDALRIPDIARWPFEVARVQLAYGEHLRRVGSDADAALQLSVALRELERLGARPWIERASSELRSTGRHPSASAPLDPIELTRQELDIAALAATGLSNREIGERLHLSHRSVSSHLHRIYPKLGIRSRAALRDALNALDDAHSSPDVD
jgi:DNA-binding NarL/FixJ family response regulator